MVNQYAMLLLFASGASITREHATLSAAREECTKALEGECFGFISRPTEVHLMVRDVGEFKSTWVRRLS